MDIKRPMHLQITPYTKPSSTSACKAVHSTQQHSTHMLPQWCMCKHSCDTCDHAQQQSSNLVSNSLFIFLFVLSGAVSRAAVLGCLLLSAHELSILVHAAMLMLPPLHVPWWPPAQLAALMAVEEVRAGGEGGGRQRGLSSRATCSRGSRVPFRWGRQGEGGFRSWG